MATNAFDVTTIIAALLKLEKEGLRGWSCVNKEQEKVMELFREYRKDMPKLKNLSCVAQLVPPLQIKVTAHLDQHVQWLEGVAEKTAIRKKDKTYPAFKLQDCDVLQVKGYGKAPLLRIETKSGDLFYIMMTEREVAGLELFDEVINIANAEKRDHSEYEFNVKAKIPMIDFNLEPDISFMCGTRSNEWTVVEATEKFKFRMNETGARAVVDVSMMALGCSIDPCTKKRSIIINRPFIGWFSHPGVALPLAAFYADFDSWKDGGSLDDM